MNAYDELLALLAKQNIEFITVGGLACAFNGYIRATDDVDILIRRNEANIRNLISVLSRYKEGFAGELSVEDFSDEEGCIRIIEDFPIDIFTRISGYTYDDLESHILYYTTDNGRIPFLDKSQLIELKKNSLRPQDQADIIRLKELS